MVPDAVVGNSGVGGQQAPRRRQLAVVCGVCTGVLQLGAKSPQGQQNLAPVLWSVLIVIEFLQQRRKVVEATLLDVVDLGVCQLLQVQSFAGQGVNEDGLVRPARLGPGSYLEGALSPTGLDRDFLPGPLGAIGCCRPPVGSLDAPIHVRRHAFFEQSVVSGSVILCCDPVLANPVQPEQSGQSKAGAVFMSCWISQQGQRFFCRVMQPGGDLGLPKRILCHAFAPCCAARVKRSSRHWLTMRQVLVRYLLVNRCFAISVNLWFMSKIPIVRV